MAISLGILTLFSDKPILLSAGFRMVWLCFKRKRLIFCIQPQRLHLGNIDRHARTCWAKQELISKQSQKGGRRLQNTFYWIIYKLRGGDRKQAKGCMPNVTPMSWTQDSLSYFWMCRTFSANQKRHQFTHDILTHEFQAALQKTKQHIAYHKAICKLQNPLGSEISWLAHRTTTLGDPTNYHKISVG